MLSSHAILRPGTALRMAQSMLRRRCPPLVVVFDDRARAIPVMADRLLDSRFQHRNVSLLVGRCLDGPRDLHDRQQMVRAARLMKAHRVDFKVLAMVDAANVDCPVELYHFLRDEIGTRFIHLIPIVEHLPEAGRVTARTVKPEQWGRFLIRLFDEWVRADVGTVFVQMFDAALASCVNGGTAEWTVPQANHDYLRAGYEAFFEHADHPMRIMADLVRRGRHAHEVMGIVAGVACAAS